MCLVLGVDVYCNILLEELILIYIHSRHVNDFDITFTLYNITSVLHKQMCTNAEEEDNTSQQTLSSDSCQDKVDFQCALTNTCMLNTHE